MNTMKTWLLMGTLSILLVTAGGLMGGQGGILIAFVFALGMNFFGYWFSDQMAIRMAGAKPLEEADAPELHAMTQRLCDRANLPMPKLYIIPQDQPNAFATGRNPERGVVAVTQGLLQMMNRDEVEGVIAHELAHIKNRDILIGSMAATFAGAITMLANMAQWAMIFGGGRGGDDEDGGIGGLVGTLLLVILGPIAAMLVQMSISRSREYIADETAAQMCESSEGLAWALEKLALGTKAIPMAVTPAASHMYIANPLRTGGMASLFSTHPPIQERVRRLREWR
jgi:heat shock protein HtpX